MFNWLKQRFFSRIFRTFTWFVWYSKGKQTRAPKYTENKVKHLIDDPQTVVFDSILGIVRCSPFLRVTTSQNSLIVTSTNQSSKDNVVSIISGGPSGSEPLDALFVGKKLLAASVCGNKVFSPPDVMSIYKAIKMTTGTAGCILLIRNHPLNKLNFSLACQWAIRDGLKVGKLLIADDVFSSSKKVKSGEIEEESEEEKSSVISSSLHPKKMVRSPSLLETMTDEFEQKNINTRNRKKGLAGTAFLIKILGSACQKGSDHRTVMNLGHLVLQNTATMGFSFEPVIVPGKNEPTFYIPKDDVMFGVGLCGEVGGESIKTMTCRNIVTLLLDKIIPCLPRHKEGDQVAVLVNNLGGLSVLEMYIFASRVIELLEQEWRLKVKRIYVGTFSSCLSMRGGSLSVLLLPESHVEELAEYLDDTQASGIWPNNFYRNVPTINRSQAFNTFRPWEGKLPGMVGKKKKKGGLGGLDESSEEDVKGLDEEEEEEEEVEGEEPEDDDDEEEEEGFLGSKRSLREVLGVIVNTLRYSEDELNDLDSPIGDADCGTSLRRGMDLIEEAEINFKDSPANILSEVGMRLYEIGGTTGTIYCSFIMALAESYRRNHDSPTENKNLLGRMLKDGCQAVMEIGGARRGDCTFLDAIVPVYERLDETGGTATKEEMAEAARLGYLATKEMQARVGKASMLKEKSIGFPDPGAKAVYNIFRDLAMEL